MSGSTVEEVVAGLSTSRRPLSHDPLGLTPSDAGAGCGERCMSVSKTPFLVVSAVPYAWIISFSRVHGTSSLVITFNLNHAVADTWTDVLGGCEGWRRHSLLRKISLPERGLGKMRPGPESESRMDDAAGSAPSP